MTEESYMDRVKKETKSTLDIIRVEVARGVSPTDAINKHAHTAETYSAALKVYNLRPDIPD